MDSLFFAPFALIIIMFSALVPHAMALTAQEPVQNIAIDRITTILSSNQSGSATNSSVASSRGLTSTLGEGGLVVELNMSGKIASSRVNLTNGNVEAVLFGNWSLSSANSTTDFAANFTQIPLANISNVTEYELGNLRIHSIQQINDILALDGRLDITSNNTTLENASTAIIIRDGILVIGFEKETRADTLFKGIPLIGFEG